MSHKMRQKGFTLIEVLVALGIIAMALPALVMRVQSVSDNTGYIEEKSYAFWIAQNQLEKLLIDFKLKQKIPRTRKGETIEYADQEWFWEVIPEDTGMQNAYMLTVNVGRDEKNILATISGIAYNQQPIQPQLAAP